MIEVEFAVGEQTCSVKGRGEYDSGDPDLGSVLRVHVADEAGDFDFVFPISTWKGLPELSDLPDCDYRLSLKTQSTR